MQANRMEGQHLIDAQGRPLMPGRYDRRQVLRGILLGVAAFQVPGLFAEQLVLTPRQTEGPFYPRDLPLDRDNDLIIVNDSLTPAAGEITHLSGRILDAQGNPVRNALVEIWQTDNNGVYLHSGSRNYARRDTNFQGYGRFETAADGEYYFRTIKPTLYPGRTRHIHYGVTLKGERRWTTQCYVQGEPRNDNDSVLRRIRDERERQSVVVDFLPLVGSTVGELAARFDVVLGLNAS